MEVKASVRLQTKQMFNFLMHHTYFSFLGYIGILISICSFGAVIYTWGSLPVENIILLIIAGMMFTVVQPLMLYRKAYMQITKNDMFSRPIEYVFNSGGIDITQEPDSTHINWNDVIKVTSTSMSVLIYLSKVRAFIITKEALGEQFDTFKAIVSKNAGAKYIKIK